MNTQELIAAITGKDESARTQAWMNAASLGAEAAGPLAVVMADKNDEIRRAATRALWRIVRHAGRPGAEAEAAAVSKALISLIAGQQPPAVTAELCWMLSEIAGDDAVSPLAQLLAKEEVREAARAALQRIPGNASLAALKAGLDAAPSDYKPALAESLRRRGVDVPGIKSVKLVPSRSTKVKPAR